MKKMILVMATFVGGLLSANACGYGAFAWNCPGHGEMTVKDFNESKEAIFMGQVLELTETNARFLISKRYKGEFKNDTVDVRRSLRSMAKNDKTRNFKKDQLWLMFSSSSPNGLTVYECSRSQKFGTKEFKRDVAFLNKVMNAANRTQKFNRLDGTLMGEGKFLNGKPHGKWNYYNEREKLILSANYDNGVHHGDWISYSPLEVELTKTTFKNGVLVYSSRKNDKGVLFNEQIVSARITTYRNYDQKGNIASSTETDHETNMITYKNFFDNGQLQRIYQYKDNRAFGVWKTFSRDGKLVKEEKQTKM
jgi:antitoxin component YwqK of YwqJK toxin-antitoxin module